MVGCFAQEFMERGRTCAFHLGERVKPGFFFAKGEPGFMGILTELRKFVLKSMGRGPKSLMAAQRILELGVRALKRLEAKREFFIPGRDLLGKAA